MSSSRGKSGDGETRSVKSENFTSGSSKKHVLKKDDDNKNNSRSSSTNRLERQKGLVVEEKLSHIGKADTHYTHPSNSKPRPSSTTPSASGQVDYIGLALFLLVVLISIVSYTLTSGGNSNVDWKNVFYYAWLTAISTGVGALPFYFIRSLDDYFVGISNAIAGGMMLSASYSLVVEGSNIDEDRDYVDMLYQPYARCLGGVIIGVIFILAMEVVLERYEDIAKLENLVSNDSNNSSSLDSTNDNDNNNNKSKSNSISNNSSSNNITTSSVTDQKQDSIFSYIFGSSGAKKMFLIVMVMTLHSLTEGIGIGVSFGTKEGTKLGRFISLSLAVHNIPEGLAVALVLTSRGVSLLRSVLWAIFTSLPQPIMAIPAFKFIAYFKKVLPAGLGFAAGAMAYVAVFELLAEAIQVSKLPQATVVNVAFASFILMTIAQETLRE